MMLIWVKCSFLLFRVPTIHLTDSNVLFLHNIGPNFGSGIPMSQEHDWVIR